MDVKDRIIESASILFLQKGYREVTIKDILERANVSRGGFYHHYQSKEEIFREIMEDYFFNDGFSEVTEGCKCFNDLIDNLLRLMESVILYLNNSIDISQEKVNILNAMKLRLEAIDLFEDFSLELEDVYKRTTLKFSSLLQNLADSGEIRKDVDFDMTANYLNIILEGCISMSICMPKTWDKKYLQGILENLYSTIKL